jgi:hypothetical protein
MIPEQMTWVHTRRALKLQPDTIREWLEQHGWTVYRELTAVTGRVWVIDEGRGDEAYVRQLDDPKEQGYADSICLLVLQICSHDNTTPETLISQLELLNTARSSAGQGTCRYCRFAYDLIRTKDGCMNRCRNPESYQHDRIVEGVETCTKFAAKKVDE